MTTFDPDDPDPAFDARLAELRGRFKSTLAPRVQRIVTWVAHLQPGDMPSAATEDLLTEVHSMAGAAAMFGIEDVNRKAAAMERAVLAIRSRSQATVDDMSGLRDACRQLETVAGAYA